MLFFSSSIRERFLEVRLFFETLLYHEIMQVPQYTLLNIMGKYQTYTYKCTDILFTSVKIFSHHDATIFVFPIPFSLYASLFTPTFLVTSSLIVSNATSHSIMFFLSIKLYSDESGFLPSICFALTYLVKRLLPFPIDFLILYLFVSKFSSHSYVVTFNVLKLHTFHYTTHHLMCLLPLELSDEC